MKEPEVIVEEKDTTVRLTLNKPAVKNAMGKNTLHELLAAFEDIEKKPHLTVVVIRGAGDTFCSGMDLKEVPTPYGEGAKEFTALADKVFTAIEKCAKITIAVIQGVCMAGGFEIAIGCDFIIAEKDCRIGDGHIRLPGFIPSGGASVRLPKLIGIKKAKQLLLTGELITGEEAKQIGLADFCADASDLNNVTEDLIAKFTDKSPIGLAHMKTLIEESQGLSYGEGLKKEHAYMKIISKTEDYQEALNARFQKRKAAFKGQ